MNQTNFWDDAAKCGAIIGCVSILCMLLRDATRIGVFGLLGFAFYCGMLLFFTRRRTAECSTAEQEYDFGQRFGFVVAISAFVGIINGAYSILACRILFSEQYAAAYDEAFGIVAATGIYPAEFLSDLQQIMLSPLVQAFSAFAGQLVLGVILGLVIAATVQPPRNFDKQSE